MNAYMNINVRVLSAQARAQIKALQAQVAGLEAQLAAANKTSMASGGLLAATPRARKSLAAMGSQLQWTGRQLQYNFTVPILLAAGAATKFALDNEKAFTRVKKVYGDTADAVAYFKKHQDELNEGMSASETVASNFTAELNALQEAFEALSTTYGISQTEVMETASAWAAAGVSGKALAKSTELSIKASLLGDIDLAKATESLIAIQSQYSLSTKDLNLTLAELNATENQTGASMAGLIDGMSRAAGSAREYGVDVRHLVAMIAALVPATGTASTAGNALKTIMSRVMAPTKEAAALMQQFGVNTASAAWQSSTAMDRLMVLARKMKDDVEGVSESGDNAAESLNKMSDSQRAVVATTLGSRYQVNRFLVLMRELNSENGYYAKALNATKNNTKVFAQSSKELNAILNSSPKRLEILWRTIQNGMADAIQPMIPYFLYLVSLIADAVKAFNDLDPAVQKLSITLLLGIAGFGLLVKLLGATLTLLGMTARPFAIAASAFVGLFTRVEEVDGVAKRFAATWVETLGKIVTAPFRLAADAIGWVEGKLLSLGGMLTKIGVTSALAAMWNTVAGIMKAGAAAAVSATATTLLNGIAAVFTNMFVWIGAAAAAFGPKLLIAFLAVVDNVPGAFRRAGILIAAEMTAWWTVIARGIAAIAIILISPWGGVIATIRGAFVVMGGVIATSMGRWRALVASGMGAIAATMAVAGTVFTTIFTQIGVVLAEVWAAALGTMQIITAYFTRTIPLMFTAMGLAIGAIQTAMGKALIALQAAWQTAQALAYRAWLASLALFEAASLVVRKALWTAGLAALTAIDAAAAAARVAIQKAWAAGMLLVQKAFTAAYLALSTAFWSRVIAIYIAGYAKLAMLAKKGIAVMLGPWGFLIATVVALLYHFRDDLTSIWNNLIHYFSDSSNALVTSVINAFNALPQGVQNAMLAVVHVIESAAKAIYNLFSYINPFAHHSPSLVENVQRGTGAVGKSFGAMQRTISAHIASAYADIKKFGNAAKGLIGRANQIDFAQNLKKVKKYAPGLAGMFSKLHATLKPLQADAAQLTAAISKQEKVVNRWQHKVDAANLALDKQANILDKLKDKQQKWQDKLDASKDALAKWSETPIIGMRAMSDAIFENEMAQKRLNLAMMDMEDAYGPLDSIKSKMEALNGTIELISGERADLRSAGAGSEILSQYDDQIAALDAQRDSIGSAAESMQNLQNQMDALQRKGERLDLLNSLQFDPLTRQIEQAATAMQEMPFDTIMAGVTQSAADIGYYTTKLDEATAATDAQQKIVDKLTYARDALQLKLDAEQTKLDKLNETYSKLNDVIQQIQQSMSDVVSAADAMHTAMEEKKKKKGAEPYTPNAVQNFKDAAGGDFASVGGAGIPMRTDWSSQEDKIKEFTDNLSKQTSQAFADINPFTPLKKYWNQFVGWMSENLGPVGSAFKDMLGQAFSGIKLPGGAGGGELLGKGWDKVQSVVDAVMPLLKSLKSIAQDAFHEIVKWGEKIWNLFGPDFVEIFQTTKKELGNALGPLVKQIKEFAPLMEPLGKAFATIWEHAKPYIGAVAGILLMVVKIVLDIIKNIIPPLITNIVGLITNIIQIIKGFVQIFIAIVNLDWRMALAGLYNIFAGTFEGLWNIVKGAAQILWAVVSGIVEGIYGFFKWLYDELIGHSIIPDIINGIFFYFKLLGALAVWVWDHVLKPLFNFFAYAWDLIKASVSLWFAGITAIWSILSGLGVWFWESVLKPVWDAVVWLWTDAVMPALALWWEGIKGVWAILIGLAVWFWDSVLKPVWDAVVWLWDNAVKPALAAWWEGIKLEWQALKTLGGWVWDHILKPVWDKVSDLWTTVKSALSKWWEGIKIEWVMLKTLGGWVWDNVLVPVWDKITGLWASVKTELGSWWERIKTAWNDLLGVGTWLETNFVDPIFKKVTGVWDSISTWFTNNKGTLMAPIKSVVNGVIGGVNKLIAGLNKIGEILPKFEWSIPEIPEMMASGGEIPARRANRGFKTTGARAIVGEAKQNYPEFVIPTDPTYRSRAVSLMGMAARKMGMWGPGGDVADATAFAKSIAGTNPTGKRGYPPQFGIGGWLSDALSSAKDWTEGLAASSLGVVMNPALDLADKLVDKAGDWEPPKAMGHGMIDKARGWFDTVNADYQAAYKKASSGKGIKAAKKFAKSQAGKPYQMTSDAVGPDYYDCSGFMSAVLNVAQGKPPHSRRGTTGTFPWAGLSSNVDAMKGFMIGSTPSWEGGTGHMAGTIDGLKIESRYGAGVVIGGGARGAYDSHFTEHAGFAGLKSGGIVRANTDRLYRLGDGRYDEAVVPLPYGYRDNLIGNTGKGSGETTNHFHGDLVFPNITDPADAETFIENLKSLTKD